MLKRIVIIGIGVLLISANAFALPVEAENISSEKYFEATLKEIDSARSSVLAVMYLISVLPDQPDAQPNQLVSALIRAKDRGVEVKVILDQNIDFEAEATDEALYRNKNQNAYELLRKNNVPVFFDTSDTYTHTKVLVIDNEVVILGSTNWSKAALTRNNETNVLIRSKEFAKSLLSDLDKVKIQENIPASLTPSVSISKEIISNKKMLSEMASQSDERAFDIYLYILKEYDGNSHMKVSLSYDKLAKSLGIDQMSIEDYRRQITKVLEKLDEKYKLIKFNKPDRNQNAEVALNPQSSSDKLDIPTSFWRYGWNKSLSFPAKVMYLINLSYTQSSPQNRFSISRESLSKAHGLSESFISDGNQNLRKLNLLDIKYSDLEDLRFDQRKPSAYTLKEMYDPAELKRDLDKLTEKHGKEKLNRAMTIASLVFEENNLKTIHALLELETQYGETIVNESAKKISEKNPDNPKRSAGYLINTIKSMGEVKS